MKPKPRGLGPEYADQFNDASVVAAYGARPPYSDRLIPLLLDLAGPTPRRVLDLGCGTGALARRLAPHVERIAAVDQSDRMIACARSLPGGDAPNIDWIVSRVEDVLLSETFSLALAAESFHWFDWAFLRPALLHFVASSALVLVERSECAAPWSGAIATLVAAFSTNREFESYDLVDELLSRDYLVLQGRITVGPERFQQSIDDYIACMHSRNGLSRDRLPGHTAARVDARAREILAPYADAGGILTLQVENRLAWGRVLACEQQDG